MQNKKLAAIRDELAANCSDNGANASYATFDAVIALLLPELKAAREALRKSILWSECALHKVTVGEREQINFTYLNDARQAIERIDKFLGETNE